MNREEANATETARQLDVKIDVAIEIMAEMVASNSLQIIELRKTGDVGMLNTLEGKRAFLLNERKLMYQRDINTVNKILTVYSKELTEKQHKSA